MQVQYNDRHTEKQCKSLKQSKKDFSDIANKLHKLINFIENADSLSDIISFPSYNFHGLKGKRKGQYALDINGRKSSYRLIVCFEKHDIELIFSEPNSIKIIQIEEVSNHYE
ncbi:MULTISPECIES: type II toxin-antitoxin system RelE/ParE family toxin [Lactococcus]|uniref:type II toxin-antitoxin system RelE/ParE family toxin n=1 Tax=Lactococcus TaxID=1357 RepID=UPI0025A1DCAB|nr:type II toxin-antitoxin system RelE/ParE family toxin [Lactococcus lactis]MDM7499950.1 type II toxin-antitoxin system RelE/ParE family toxin [Lactococcus lactis]